MNTSKMVKRVMHDGTMFEGRLDYRVYDSVQGFADAAANDATDCPDGKRQSRKFGADSEWDAGAGFDGAVKMAREGWAEGRERITRIAEKFRQDILGNNRQEFQSPQFTRSVVGSGVNVGRFNAGMPDAMIVRKPMPMSMPVINIVFNLTCSGGIGAEAYMERGAAVAALVDLLELAGRRVSVTAVLSDGHSSDQHAEYVVRVKHAGDPLQIDALAFALVHPAFFRRIGFSVLETMDKASRKRLTVGDGGRGYGWVTEAKFDRGDLYMPGMTWNENWNDAKAAAWVHARLVDMGVLKKEDAAA